MPKLRPVRALFVSSLRVTGPRATARRVATRRPVPTRRELLGEGPLGHARDLHYLTTTLTIRYGLPTLQAGAVVPPVVTGFVLPAVKGR
jgi:hypothetical protein